MASYKVTRSSGGVVIDSRIAKRRDSAAWHFRLMAYDMITADGALDTKRGHFRMNEANRFASELESGQASIEPSTGKALYMRGMTHGMQSHLFGTVCIDRIA